MNILIVDNQATKSMAIAIADVFKDSDSINVVTGTTPEDTFYIKPRTRHTSNYKIFTLPCLIFHLIFPTLNNIVINKLLYEIYCNISSYFLAIKLTKKNNFYGWRHIISK